MPGHDVFVVRQIILKIHIYAGLLSFSHLVIYGIAGLVATVQTSLERPKIARNLRFVPFTVQANLTDKQVADQVWHHLNLPLTRPVPNWFLQRTPQGDLLLDFYNINGIRRVVVLEREQRLRIEDIRNSTAIFLEDVHAATTGDREAPPLIHVWAVWNEFAMWSLLAFCVSGVYLWLAARPPGVWAYACLGVGTAAFAILYVAMR